MSYSPDLLKKLENSYGNFSRSTLLTRLSKRYGSYDKDNKFQEFSKPVNQIDNIEKISSNKFESIVINDINDWKSFKNNALDVSSIQKVINDYKNITQVKDSEDIIKSADILNRSLNKYLQRLNDVLKIPEDIDEESSYDFTDKLISTLTDYFTSLMDAYYQGLNGPQHTFYSDIKTGADEYLKKIHLIEKVTNKGSDVRDATDYMKVIYESSTDPTKLYKIYDIMRPAFYLQYQDEDGVLQKMYLNGKCSAFKKA